MYTTIKNFQIVGMAAAVPTKWVSIKDVSDESESFIDKFIKNTGVEGRYEASRKQTTSDFCFAAAEHIICDKQIRREKIGILVFVTQTPDYETPATACLLQKRLGLSKDCIAFDINLGCSGFTYGITMAASLLNTTDTQYALLLCGDTSAKEKNYLEKEKTTHSAALLFGDSGTATLIEKVESAPNILVSSKTDGQGFKAIITPYKGWRHPEYPVGIQKGTQMDDYEVFNFATTEVTEQINSYMHYTSTSPEDYDCLVLHQANLLIIKRIAKKTNFSMNKTLVSIDKFGNTSSSSIPVSLVKEYGNQEHGGMINALCCGFGIGLSWSTVALRIDTKDIYPLIHTDDFFDDGYPDV